MIHKNTTKMCSSYFVKILYFHTPIGGDSSYFRNHFSSEKFVNRKGHILTHPEEKMRLDGHTHFFDVLLQL